MTIDMHNQPQNYEPNADYPKEKNPYKPPQKVSGDAIGWTAILVLIFAIIGFGAFHYSALFDSQPHVAVITPFADQAVRTQPATSSPAAPSSPAQTATPQTSSTSSSGGQGSTY